MEDENDDVVVEGIIPVKKQQIQLMLEAGYLYMEMNKYPEAEEVFTGTAALVPHSEVPQMALGHLYFSMGRFQPALKAHQKAAELNPQSASAHAAMGEALLFIKRYDDAMAALDQAIALEPEGPASEFAAALKEAHSLGVFS